MAATDETIFPVVDYDLDATLASGQAFRWRRGPDVWTGVVAGRWVRLAAEKQAIRAQTAGPVADWGWLADYLQTGTDLAAVLASFPEDEPMRRAVAACRGLRLLRQDPWECLASFILSSTKQIVQIEQIVSLLCERFGEPLNLSGVICGVEPGAQPGSATGRTLQFSFPPAARIATATEAELRDCRMGFRAPYLLAAARRVAAGGLDLEKLRGLDLAEARAQLMELPGVGRKIADCVLLFAGGFPTAFPVDVWVMKALQHLYFPKRRASPGRIGRFAATHFGPHAGYAQQYLFHYMRTKKK